MKHRPQAILFDWDNTLVASMEVICQAVNHVREKFGKQPLPHEQVYNNTHQAPRDAFLELFGAKAPEATVIFYEFLNAIPMEKRFAPLQGAQILLNKLKLAGIPMGVVSNKQAAILRSEVDFIAWQDYFQVVIGSGDATADKPSAAPLQLALERMGLQASSNIWFIGDSPVDWEAAQQSGCRPFSIHVAAPNPAVSHVTDLHHLGDIIDFDSTAGLPT